MTRARARARVEKRTLLVAIVVALSLVTHGAYGETKDEASRKRAARAQYEEGERAFNARDFRRAGDLFEGAYKALPHHSPLWNAARAWFHANEDVRAANLLERYLREAPPNAPDRDNATQLLNQLGKRLGRIEFIVHDVTDVKLDDEAVEGNRRWVSPGEHVATASASRGLVRKVVSVRAGERMSVTLEYAEQPTTTVVVAPAQSTKPLPPWIVVAGGVLTLGGAGVTVWSGLDTIERRDAYQKQPSSAALLEDAHSAQTRTNIVLGASIGVAVLTVAAAAFLVDWGGDSSPANAQNAPAKPWKISAMPTCPRASYMDRSSAMDSL